MRIETESDKAKRIAALATGWIAKLRNAQDARELEHAHIAVQAAARADGVCRPIKDHLHGVAAEMRHALQPARGVSPTSKRMTGERE